MLPPEVDRDNGEHDAGHGEYESAIASLLTDAFLAGKLPQEVIDYAASEYEHGVVAVTLEYVACQTNQSAA
ncbi:hypothetical protein [Corynebacterium kutscheri]|nr:hypothetical protein [Corynebacterium kutscheri]